MTIDENESNSSCESTTLPPPVLPTSDSFHLSFSNYLPHVQGVQEVQRLRVELACTTNRLHHLQQDVKEFKIQLHSAKEEAERASFLEKDNACLKWKIETLKNEKSVLDLQNTLWVARFTNLSSRFREMNDAYLEFSRWFQIADDFEE